MIRDEFQEVIRVQWVTYYFGADDRWHNARTGDVVERDEIVAAIRASDGEWARLVPEGSRGGAR